MRARRIIDVLRHPISQNVIALYWLQIATFVVPLVTLPYVARVLHSSAFGLVVFSQGLSIVLTGLIDWGFTYSGVRDAAAKRDDRGQLTDAVARIRGAQLLLAAASIPVAFGAFLVVPKMHDHPGFLALAWIAAVATGLSPGWYFVGIERLRLISLIQLGFRVAGAALTFVLVHHPSQAWIVMALFAASSLAGWLASDLLMYRRVEFRAPMLRPAIDAVRGATPLFIGTVATTLYTSFNVVLLGLFVPSARVAHFGAGERILRVSLQVLGPIGAAVYPRLAALQADGRRERARRLLGIAVAAAGAVGLLLAAGLAVFASTIVKILFGREFVHEAAPILRILVLIIPIAIVGAIAGTWLMTLHQDRLVVRIVLRAGLLNIVLGCILTPLFGPIGMAWSVVAAEATAAIGGLVAVYRADRNADVPLLGNLLPARGGNTLE
jgi:PST family polysaccharide transporter